MLFTPDVTSVEPLASVSVPVVVVIVSPFIEVAVATPSTGVIRVGDVCNTTVDVLPVVVAAVIAVPFPARTGALIVVERVIAGVVVDVATVPAKPLALTTDTLVTVPDPPATSTNNRPVD